MLASGCNAHTIKLWNAADNDQITRLDALPPLRHPALCFSPAGETLASGSEDKTVKFWSVVSHLEVGSVKCDDHVRQVSFSPDGNHLAIVTDKGTLRLLHAVSLQEADREEAAFGK